MMYELTTVPALVSVPVLVSQRPRPFLVDAKIEVVPPTTPIY